MIKSRFTKAVLENEEGMTHLWIHIAPLGPVEKARVQIILPVGVYRQPNLSGFHETETNEIVLENPVVANDIVIELFTREPVIGGEKTVILALTFNDNTRMEHYVSLKVMPEDEIEDYHIDQEASEKVKQLKQQQLMEQTQQCPIYSPTHIYKIDPNKLSDLEKKYRIDY